MRRALAVAFACIMFGAHLARAQDTGIFGITTQSGMLLIWNQPEDHFTVEIPGKQIAKLPGTDHFFFSVDGVVVQVGTAGVEQFAPTSSGTDAQSVLVAHRDWEVAYIREALGASFDVTSESVDLGAVGKGLLWSYAMPRGVKTEVKRQLYLTVFAGDGVILFNGAVTAEADERRVRELLVAIASSLRVSPTPIDVEKLQQQLKDG